MPRTSWYGIAITQQLNWKLYFLPGRGALGAAGRQLSDHSNNRESSLDDSGVVDDHDDGEHTSDDQATHSHVPHPRRSHLHPPMLSLVNPMPISYPQPPTPVPQIQQVTKWQF